MFRSKFQTGLLVFGLILGNFFLGLIVLGTDWGEKGPPADISAQYLSYQAFGFFIAAIFLPFALSHHPKEAEGEFDYPGTTRALVSSLIVIACGGSAFAVVSCIVVFTSLVARRSVIWIAASVIMLVANILISHFLEKASWSWEPQAAIDTAIGLIMLLVPSLLIGFARGRNRERHFRLQRAASMNQRDLLARMEGARRHERVHIARDMHDSLSHRLSLIAIHAGALSHSNSGLSPEMTAAAETIREQSEAAIDDLRHVLHALREENLQDPRVGVEELVRVARESGEDIELVYSGGARLEMLDNLGLMAQHTVHRALQEGLTNARKHAPGEKVTITVTKGRNSIRVRMRNKNTSTDTSDGFGLIGLTERAELTGGTFTVVNGEDFYWDLELPRDIEHRGEEK